MSEISNDELFLMQKETLDTFLRTNAITREQYDFSLNGLAAKLGVDIEKYVE